MRLFLNIKGNSPTERIVRGLAMLVLIIMVGTAFWMNNKRLVTRLNIDRPYWDETRTVSAEDRKFFKDFIETMHDEFGINAWLHIRKGDPSPSEDVNPEDLYIGLSPAENRVVVVMPASVDPEESAQFTAYLESNHFQNEFGLEEDWVRGLKSGLILVWDFFKGKDWTGTDSPSLETSKNIMDETGTLTMKDLDFVQRFCAGLEEHFGQQCRIRIFKGDVVVPELDSKTMFMGISPESGDVAVMFPVMMRKAMGPQYEVLLREEHFPQYFEANDWPTGLKTALIDIWKALAGEEIAAPGQEDNQ